MGLDYLFLYLRVTSAVYILLQRSDETAADRDSFYVLFSYRVCLPVLCGPWTGLCPVSLSYLRVSKIVLCCFVVVLD